jgi:hypothetical protein
MLRGYRKFVSLQKTTRNLDESTNFNKLFDDQMELIEGNYSDDISAIRNSLSLVSGKQLIISILIVRLLDFQI